MNDDARLQFSEERFDRSVSEIIRFFLRKMPFFKSCILGDDLSLKRKQIYETIIFYAKFNAMFILIL